VWVGGDRLQARLGGGAVQLVAQHVLGDAAALVGEQELDHAAAAGVAQRPARGTVHHDAVHQLQGLLVQRHHAFGVELAQGDLQPGALASDLVDAVQLQVAQLTDPQPGRTLQQQRVGA
jgi:hypothetical protein